MGEHMKANVRFFLVLLFISVSAQAAPLLPAQVPEPLKPWISWVLQDQTELDCPFSFQNFEQKRCSSPSRLDMDFSATVGKFSIDWQV
jgi:hypothetical protein